MTSDGIREEKDTAFHIGRIGEVAGGMTQVLNAYERWPFERFNIRVISSRDGGGGLGALTLFLRAAFAVGRIPRDRKTVAVFHLSQGGSFIREGLLVFITSIRTISTVAQLHGSSFVDFARRHPRLVKAVLGRADIIHVLSEATEKEVRRLLPSAHIRLVANAVENGKAAAKMQTVVFGGAVSYRKGVDVLLRAWDAAGDNTLGWQLLVAGPILDKPIVTTVPDRVTILGALEHSALLDLLDKSRIAVLPSLREAMPMFLLEAMARRNALISTSVGGIPPLLEGGRGFLVEPGDDESLRHALVSAMTESDSRDQVAERGHRYFLDTYSTDHVMPILERLWSDAIEMSIKS